MKKFLSILLSFVMLLTLTMPAMAAEVTGNTQDVTANYTPGTIAFTGLEIEDNFEYRYDESTRTYTMIIPTNSTTGNVGFHVVGTNLTFVGDDNTDLIFKAESGFAVPSESLIETLQTHGYFGWGIYNMGDGATATVSYSNDGGTTWTEYHFVWKQAYSIANGTAADANGSISVPEYALAGDTVAVTVTPNIGYALDTLTVMNGETEIAVDSNNMFEMPAGAVTVTATFKEAPVSYTVTLPESVENGSVSVDPTEYTEGQTVTLNVVPNNGYELNTLTIMCGDTEVAYTKVEGEENKYSFTMPACNVSVSATFKALTAQITDLYITVDGTKYDSTNTSESDPAKITPNSVVTVTVIGENFAYLPTYENGVSAFVYFGANYVGMWEEDSYTGEWNVDKTSNTATYTANNEILALATSASELKYTNDKTVTFVGSGVWVIYEIPTYTITGYSDANGNKVEADVTEANEGDTVTLTVTTTGTYQLKDIAVKDADNNIVDFTSTGAASGTYTFVMPASNVTVEATFEDPSKISVEITWGSMSFTYDDTIDETTNEEKGWGVANAADAQVTVKNTGESEVTAKAAYESYEGYESITGSFNPASYDLDVGTSYTFTLELSGKPTKVLSDAKIGKVTITIE